MSAEKVNKTGPCVQCQALVGAGGGKQPHSQLEPITKYRAASARPSSTADFRCKVCGFEWRYDRRNGWGPLGL